MRCNRVANANGETASRHRPPQPNGDGLTARSPNGDPRVGAQRGRQVAALLGLLQAEMAKWPRRSERTEHSRLSPLGRLSKASITQPLSAQRAACTRASCSRVGGRHCGGSFPNGRGPNKRPRHSSPQHSQERLPRCGFEPRRSAACKSHSVHSVHSGSSPWPCLGHALAEPQSGAISAMAT